MALPGMAEAYPGAKLSAATAEQAEGSAAKDKAQWTPQFLDPHQYETLVVLAERLVPGSTQAESARFIDLLLSVDTQDAQKKFLESMSAFEAESLRRFSHPFKDLTEAQQSEILTLASTTRPAEGQEDQPLQATLGNHFSNLKGWISRAYFSSETGMKDLGWTGQVYFSSFPGCQQSSGKPS